ncbi:hypothetical protein [Rhodopirellula europaea]|uniref:hypothetical protein n=1 Tax=Rhodopirellula europaea TaxID=1263866 RepID=UPI0005871AB3|nr:hypothetical protein [Rhodopirellula europaea]
MSNLHPNTSFIAEYGYVAGWSELRIYCAMHAVETHDSLRKCALSNGDDEDFEELADLAEEHYEHLFPNASLRSPRREEEASTPAAQHHSSHRNKHVWQHVAVHGLLMVLGHFFGHKHR